MDDLTFTCAGRPRRLRPLPSGRILSLDSHEPGERALMAIRGEECRCREFMHALVTTLRWGSPLGNIPAGAMPELRLRVARRRLLGHGMREHSAFLSVGHDCAHADFQRGVVLALSMLPRPRGACPEWMAGHGWDAIVMLSRTGHRFLGWHDTALQQRLDQARTYATLPRVSANGWKLAESHIVEPGAVMHAELHYLFDGQQCIAAHHRITGPGALIQLTDARTPGEASTAASFAPGYAHRLDLSSWLQLAARNHPTLRLTLPEQGDDLHG